MTELAPDPLPARVTYCGVTADDFEELAALRIAAMRESLERVGRFDPERARERLRKSFYPDHTQFILLDGQRIGFYTFRPADDRFHLDHLYIHPSCQSRGVGACVMHHLLAQADARRLPVQLGALRDSASNRFYQRHGFVQTGEDEWDIYYVRAARAKGEEMNVPRAIDGFTVIEFGFFPEPILPKGYIPPSDGRSPLKPAQNLAICTAAGVDGFYLLYCTSDWKYVTYSYHETIDATKLNPVIEFGQDVTRWNVANQAPE